MTHAAVQQRCVLAVFRWLTLLCLSMPAGAEPVAQAMAHHGGSIVLTDRRGNCAAGEMMALDIRPAGYRVAYVTGCARGVRDGIAITWTGWPGARVYARGAFRMTQRDLRWLD